MWNIFKESNTYASNFQPKNLINTPLSNFLYEDKSTVPYISQEDLLIALSDSMFLENRFNFIYYPNIDVSAHVFGVNSDEWNKEVKKFEELVKKISELSNKKSYTVISADHGLTNIPKENRFHLAHQEDINIYGDQRSVYVNGSEKKIIEALLTSVKRVFYVGLLLFIILYIYATIGSILFSTDIPERWSDVGVAMITLFQVLTLSSWEQVMLPLQDVYWWAWIYFFSFIIICGITMLNLLIAILVDVVINQKKL